MRHSQRYNHFSRYFCCDNARRAICQWLLLQTLNQNSFSNGYQSRACSLLSYRLIQFILVIEVKRNQNSAIYALNNQAHHVIFVGNWHQKSWQQCEAPSFKMKLIDCSDQWMTDYWTTPEVWPCHESTIWREYTHPIKMLRLTST